MPDAKPFSDLQMIKALKRATCRGDGLVMVGDLCFALGARRETVEAVLRDLETRGIAICTPTRGPIAVVGLTEGAKLILMENDAEIQRS